MFSYEKRDFQYDAWGRQKQVADLSIFRGLFTYNVDPIIWKEYVDDVEQVGISGSSSVDGGLRIASTTGVKTSLQSQRHPRYQPNRGHLWSSAIWLPTAGEAGTVRDFGLGTPANKIAFRLTDAGLWAVITRAGVEVSVTRIPTPADFDETVGHLYDIQYQWRGVGDYFFYVDQRLLHSIQNLGRKGEGQLPALANPAISARFDVEGNASIRAGCVDITSEGGTTETFSYRSISTPVDITTLEATTDPTGTPMLALKMTGDFLSSYNARDALIHRISAFCDTNYTAGVYITRDPAVLGGIADNADPLLGWADLPSVQSPVKYMLGGTGSLLRSTFVANRTDANTRLISIRRAPANNSLTLDLADENVYFTNGDYLIVTVRPANINRDAGASIEWDEEI